jgi:hypothetical protein
MDQAEDVIQNLRVVRILLEPHQLIVDGVEALARLRQEFPQQIVHESTFREFGVAADCRPPRTETDRWIASLRAGSRWRQPMEFFSVIDSRAGLSFPLIKTSVQIRRNMAG